MKKWFLALLLMSLSIANAATPPAKPQIVQPAGRYQIYETEHATYLLDSATGTVWRSINCNPPAPEGTSPYKVGLALSCWEQNVFFGVAGSGDRTPRIKP